MKLSVIIPCLNAAETIGDQLEAFANQEWDQPWELIVADNGSTDKTLEIVERYKSRLPNLRVVDASEQRGPSHARNVGAKTATGEALAFCDADDEVGTGWVAAIGEAVSKHGFVASRFEKAKLNPPHLLDIYGKAQENDIQSYGYPPYLPHAGGCGLAVKRVHYDAVGGFDNSFLYCQDTDFCWRVQLTGVKLQFAPEAVVHIRFRNGLRSIFRQTCHWGKYNAFLYKKYRPLGMPKLTCKPMCLQWLRMLKGLTGLRHREGRYECAWDIGWRIGRLYGSIKYRVLAL